MSVKQILEQSKLNQFKKKMELDPILREVKLVCEIVLDKILPDKVQEFSQKINSLIKNTEKELEILKKGVKKGDKGDKPIAGIDYPIPQNGDDYILTEEDKQEIASKIEVPIVEKVIEKTEIIKEKPVVAEVAMYETAEQIADKLNTLEQAIDKDVIRGLSNELQNLRKSISDLKRQKGGAGAGGGGYPVKSYDISDQLNGVLKTFTIPKNKYVIDAKISGPVTATLRPTIDYTYTATTITFTDEIGASTYLSVGQSAIVIYAED